MEIDYKPKSFESADSAISGNLKLKLPTVLQKYDYMDRCGFQVGLDGEMDLKSLSAMKFMKTMIEISENHYVNIDLKKKDGRQIKDFQSMIEDPDCEPVLVEVASNLLNGFKPSGN